MGLVRVPLVRWHRRGSGPGPFRCCSTSPLSSSSRGSGGAQAPRPSDNAAVEGVHMAGGFPCPTLHSCPVTYSGVCTKSER